MRKRNRSELLTGLEHPFSVAFAYRNIVSSSEMMAAVAQSTTSTGMGPAPQGWVRRLWRENNRHLIFITSLVLLLVVWHISVQQFQIRSYVLPPPLEVLRALWDGIVISPFSRQSLLYHMGVTLRGAMIGYAVGVTSGLLLAVAITESKFLERLIFPYAVMIQSVPKIALAPLLVIWLGPGFANVIALTALITFFPILLNAYHGLNSPDRDYLRLMRSVGASRWQVLRWVKFPAAAALIFAGLDIAVIYALIGALVAEFVAGNEGIGVLILRYQYINATDGVFAALFVLGAAGSTLHHAVLFAQRKVVFWQPKDSPSTRATA